MAFIRAQKRKTKKGVRTYYYLVENKRENGKVKQKVLKYLGTNPNKISVDLTVEQCTAILGSSILSTATAEELKRKLHEIGICVLDGAIEKIFFGLDVPQKTCSLVLIHHQLKNTNPKRKNVPNVVEF
jgi:mannitol-specific phosphotransferase system IIBC component